jgi:hypothetical protein
MHTVLIQMLLPLPIITTLGAKMETVQEDNTQASAGQRGSPPRNNRQGS